MKLKSRKELRGRRHRRVRRKISGTGERPRMALFVSNRAMSVQFVDDEKGVTLASARAAGKTVDAARELGRIAAEAALGRGISGVVVDRGGFKYHGRVRAVVEAAREAGLLAGQVRAESAAAEAGDSAQSESKEES